MDRERFEQALLANMGIFDVELTAETVTQLGAYYSLLTKWNDRLHLVAPCSPEQFASRHVLESLLLLKYLPQQAKIADIGSGGGLPIIPCLIARSDLRITMIESSQKKSIFLRETLNTVGRAAIVIARPFEDVESPDVSFITCRALDRFMSKLPALLDWSPKRSKLLLLGGENLDLELRKAGLIELKDVIPGSEKRFLFLFAAPSEA